MVDLLGRSKSTWTERLAIAGLLVASIVLLRLTFWKENELFWLDVGGYPLWLRQSVESLYYPYLLTVVMSAATVCWSFAIRFCRTLMLSRAWFVLFAALLLIAVSMTLLVSNNVDNFINGRPVHYHGSQDYNPELEVYNVFELERELEASSQP